MQRSERRAIVIGGSMGGLFAGLFLLRLGWQVDIFERIAVELSGRGAGIVTHPELVDALAQAGLYPGDALGITIEDRRTLDREGRVIADHHRPQTTTSWNGLFQMLRDAFPIERYHLHKELTHSEVSEAGVIARFTDGSSAAGDVLIAADGFRSTVRRQFLPGIEPLYAGYAAWRGLVDEAALSLATHRDLFNSFAFCLPPGEQMLGYPVAGQDDDLRPGHRRYNFVWYRPAAKETGLARMLTDESGHRHEISIPPPLIARAVVDEMHAASARVLSPQFQELVALTPRPFLQPIYDLESDRLAFARVALLGDAAFVARPHVGAGVAKAAMDAQVLVEALAAEADVPAALLRYEDERLTAGRRVVDQARRLGSYMRDRFDTDEERALARRHQTPEAVMRETAVLDFLRR